MRFLDLTGYERQIADAVVGPEDADQASPRFHL